MVLSGVPAVLLTVSGPGFVHGLAGLSGSTSNTWPLVLISGSSEQGYVGRGDFQELDQVKAAEPYAKVSGEKNIGFILPPYFSFHGMKKVHFLNVQKFQ